MPNIQVKTNVVDRVVGSIRNADSQAVVDEHPDRSRWAWAAARIALGFTFFWAFIDKLFGLGFSTPVERAWINGGNPTFGFLSNATGPFADFYHAIAGDLWVNVLFMGGLALIGLALLSGIGMRVAAVSGTILMLLMYGASLPLETNPILDEHIIYAIVLIGLALSGAGRTLGLGQWWSKLAAVRKYPVLE